MCSKEDASLEPSTPDATEGRPTGRLYRLATSCPKCGARPAMRVAEEAVRDAHQHAPGERLGTYQCQYRRCGTIYDLTAAAYQNASS